MAGTCKQRTVKADTSEILLYVSNADADFMAEPFSQTGTLDHPYCDLMKAVNAAYGRAAPFLLGPDSQAVAVRVVLFKGDHFVLKQAEQTRDVGQDSLKNIRVVLRYCAANF